MPPGTFTCEVEIPKGLTPGNTVIFGSDTTNCKAKVYASTLASNNTSTQIDPSVAGDESGIPVGTIIQASKMAEIMSKKNITWNTRDYYLTITVTTDGADEIYGGSIVVS